MEITSTRNRNETREKGIPPFRRCKKKKRPFLSCLSMKDFWRKKKDKESIIKNGLRGRTVTS
jgi:hypothetical protein